MLYPVSGSKILFLLGIGDGLNSFLYEFLSVFKKLIPILRLRNGYELLQSKDPVSR